MSYSIHEPIQDGHHFANEVITRIRVGLDEMKNETARAAFREEFGKQYRALWTEKVERQVRFELPRQFIKPNIGFYWELSKYFMELKRKRKKSIKLDTALEYMQGHFPALTRRRFYVYIIDKRQWRKKGFSFNSKSKTLYF